MADTIKVYLPRTVLASLAIFTAGVVGFCVFSLSAALELKDIANFLNQIN